MPGHDRPDGQQQTDGNAAPEEFGQDCTPPFARLFGSAHHGPFAGRRGARMFDAGALRLMVLALIAEQPRHGYDIIATLKESFQGSYSPSAGAIYPLLKSLAKVGFVRAEPDGPKRRLFSITPAGQAWLDSREGDLGLLQEQIRSAAQPIADHQLGQAIAAFRHSLYTKIRSQTLNNERARKIVQILAAAQIDINNA